MQLGSTRDVALVHHRGICLSPRALYCSLPPIITAVLSQKILFFKQKQDIRGARDKRPESAHEPQRKGETLIRTNVKQLQEESS